MDQNKQVNGGEIDLFALFETLWAGKLGIFVFVLISLFYGGISIYFTEGAYQTKVRYEIDLVPPFIPRKQVERDIARVFFSVDNFSRWKTSVPNSGLMVDLVDEKITVEGTAFAVPLDQRFLLIEEGNLLINTNDARLINDIVNYMTFVRTTVSEQYFEEVKMERTRIKKFTQMRYGDDVSEILNHTTEVNSYDLPTIIERDLAIERYLDAYAGGRKSFLISRPSMPEKVGPSNSVILVLSAICGMTIGVIFVLFRHAFESRRTLKSNQNA